MSRASSAETGDRIEARPPRSRGGLVFDYAIAPLTVAALLYMVYAIVSSLIATGYFTAS